MSLTIILYTVLAAAIAAGAGFLASGLLQGVLDLKYRPYWLVALVAGAAGTATFAIMWSTEESVGRLRLAGHEASS